MARTTRKSNTVTAELKKLQAPADLWTGSFAAKLVEPFEVSDVANGDYVRVLVNGKRAIQVASRKQFAIIENLPKGVKHSFPPAG